MDLIVEKDFLLAFSDSYEYENTEFVPSRGQEIINNIFSTYTEINLYIDCNNYDEIDELKKYCIPLIQLSDYNTFIKPIGDIKEYLSNYTNPQQGMVLLLKKESWTRDLFKRGFLAIHFENFENEIENIIRKTHFKVDLSDKGRKEFKDWSSFSVFNCVPFNTIILFDRHIIKDKKVNKNIIPLLLNYLNDKNSSEVNIAIFTEEKMDNIKYVESIHKNILNGLSNFNIKLTIFKNDKSINEFGDHSSKTKIDLHDRILYTNFSVVDTSRGFNINFDVKYNAQIISETILEKYTYKRWKNHLRMIKKYCNKLDSREQWVGMVKKFPLNENYNVLLD